MIRIRSGRNEAPTLEFVPPRIKVIQLTIRVPLLRREMHTVLAAGFYGAEGFHVVLRGDVATAVG